MNARNLLLWLHIVVAMVTMGPLILLDVVGPMLLRAKQVQTVRSVEKVVGKIGPATILIPILGLALVAEGGYELKDRWIIAALVIYVMMVGNGIGILGKAVMSAANRIEAGEEPTAELATMKVFGALNIALFLLILWLMVAKPGL